MEWNGIWQNTRPDHNPIVAGNWPPKADEVSMEEGLAKRLNVALGDTVTFMGDTQEFRAKVTSLRKVDWESLRPNFYFIFPEGALDGQPQSWLTSFRWENGNGMLTQLNRQFPTISLLDIGAILKQVGQVLEQVSRALEVMVVLVTATPQFPSRQNFIRALLSAHPEITTIVQNVNSRRTSVLLGDREQTLYGPGFIRDTLCGMTFRISPRSFYQINPAQTEVLYRRAIEAAGLTGREKVVDAYCGIGTIGMIAAAHAGEVIGVEQNPAAVRDAIRNAKENGVKNIRFVAADATAWMQAAAEENLPVDVLLMDPPRSGSDEKFLRAVCTMAPPRVVYISCNPNTQARDVEYLVKHGYQLTEVQPVDMFPYTEHIECVVMLEK